MKKQMRILAMLAVIAALVMPFGCKDDNPTPITVSSLTVGGADLNGATSPTGVATNAPIVITFNTNVDETTANATNITLTRDYDKAVAATTITTAGNVVTVTPTGNLSTGNLYVLAVSADVKSDKGLALTSLTRNFTTAGFFELPGQAAYWAFEGNGNDATGAFNASSSTGVTYVSGRNTTAGQAASFNGATSIMEVPGADAFLNNKDFTLSFWVKADGSNTKGNFVLGLGAWKGFQFEIAGDWSWVKLASQYDEGSGKSDSEDNWWPGNGQTKDNGGWQGWTFNKDVSGAGGVGAIFKDKWTHVVCTYASATKVATMYVNGEKVKSHDFNLWPAGDLKAGIVGVKYAGNPAPANNLAFGFIQAAGNRVITDTWADPSDPANNHFKGLLDDVRIFKKTITADEVSKIYNSEK